MSFDEHSSISTLSEKQDLRHTCGYITLLRTGKPNQNRQQQAVELGSMHPQIHASPLHRVQPQTRTQELLSASDSGRASPHNGIQDTASAEMLASELDSLDKALNKPDVVTRPQEHAGPARDKLTLDVGENAPSVDTSSGSPDDSVETDWVLLDLCYGIPLFHADVNQQVCERIASQGLCTSDRSDSLTHCGLVVPYGNRDLGHHWLR